MAEEPPPAAKGKGGSGGTKPYNVSLRCTCEIVPVPPEEDEEGKLGPLPQLYLRYAFANGDSVNTCEDINH